MTTDIPKIASFHIKIKVKPIISEITCTNMNNCSIFICPTKVKLKLFTSSCPSPQPQPCLDLLVLKHCKLCCCVLEHKLLLEQPLLVFSISSSSHAKFPPNCTQLKLVQVRSRTQLHYHAYVLVKMT